MAKRQARVWIDIEIEFLVSLFLSYLGETYLGSKKLFQIVMKKIFIIYSNCQYFSTWQRCDESEKSDRSFVYTKKVFYFFQQAAANKNSNIVRTTAVAKH